MVSAKNKAIANYLRTLYKNTPEVTTVKNDDESLELDVAVMNDFPEEGIRSFSTLGLSDTEILDDDGNALDFRVEIFAADDTGTNIIPDLLFEIYAHMKDDPEWNCIPGSTLEDVIEIWLPDSPMKHVYFAPCFLVEELSEMHHFDQDEVIWVMMIPISQKELEFLLENGDDAFDDLMEQKEVNILDLNRSSVL